MRLLPAMFVVFAFVSPPALVVYFVTSNLYRIGMQHYITRTLYHGEDSLGAQAHRATGRGQEAARRRTAGPGPVPPAGQQGEGSRQPTNVPDGEATDDHAAAQGPPDGTGNRPRPTSRTAPGPRTGPRRRRSGSRPMEWVETTGKSVEEAKDAALDQLGVDEQDAEFEVVEEPRTGLFGRTRGEARVRARVRPTQPRPKVERRDGGARGQPGARHPRRQRRRSSRPSGRGRRGGQPADEAPAP